MGGKSSTISTSEQRVLSLQVQQSSQGLTLPVVYGRTRVAGNLIWYGDFTAIEHKTETRMGGKGGGGGVNQVDIKYTYEAAVMMALCEGTIKGVTRVWRDKEKFTNIAELRLNLAKGESEQPVWTHLNQAKHQAQALNYSDTAYIYSPNYELTKSAQVYSHNFEVDGKLGYSAHIVDANPRDILVDLLTNHNYGCGFPLENMGDTDVYSVYCRATGIFLSPSYNEQTEAQQNIADLLQQTNSAAVFSQGRLKIIPYGDAQVAGNGALYTPNLTPVYDLTDDDFIVSGANDPVSVERKTNADAYNQVQIEYLDRSNDYNIAVAEAKDQANIEQYGLRPQDAIQMHAICEAKVAQQVAQLLLQRALYVRNEYEFKLGWKYCLLEPMDLVTLTDSGLGLDKKPVRITEIEEDEDGTLTVRAEDFPFGAANATAYPTQPSLGYSADYNIAPGNAHAPVMFEAPLHLTNNEPQIWLATAGGDNWGGAEVWVSTDGDSYVRIGVTNSKARYGSTAAALPAGAVYDNVNTLPVTIGAGHLESTTQQNARDMLTPCYVDGEFLAYETAALTGVGKYTLSKLVRGAWGSSASRHEAGTPFVRLDSALFRYTFDRKWLGKTIWVKLVSFNVFGSGLQELGEVPAYSYRIVGAPLGQVANLRLTSAWTYGKNASVVWDKLDGADSYDIEVYAANSQTRLRSVEGVVDNQYTYTLQDMKADGGQVRNVVFKVRGRAVTGKTGAWAQVVAQNPQLQALQGIEVESGIKQAFFRCTAPTEEDFAGIILWVSDNPACPTIDANKVYDGQDTFVVINKCNGKALDGAKRYYLRAAGYDSFDKATLNISQSVAFGVSEVGELVKEISESSLAQSLKDRINLIDGNGAGSVNDRLREESAARSREISTITAKLAAGGAAGGNLLPDSEMKYGLSKFIHHEAENEKFARGINKGGNTLDGRNIGYVVQKQNLSSNYTQEFARIPVEKGKYYQISCYVQLVAGQTDRTEIYFRPLQSGAWSLGGVKSKVVGGSGFALTAKPFTGLSSMVRRVINVHISETAQADSVSLALNFGRKTGGAESLQLFAMPMICEVGSLDAAPVPYSAGPDPEDAVALIENFKQAQAAKDRTTAERIRTVQTKADGNSAAIQTHTRSINGLEAQYTVKTDVNGHVAGYGLATTANNGTPTSKFIVSASQFGVGAAGKGTSYPFVVDTVKNRIGINGELVVNGKAIIDNLAAGDITGDKIRANSLHANRLTAGSVTARELAARSINADKLNVTKLSAISADMGDVTAGTMNIRNKFTVGAGGDVTIQSGTGKVGMKITNSNIVVYDGNGRVRAVFGALGVN
ncbi:TPA: phage tail protein [Neisseria weaveri]